MNFYQIIIEDEPAPFLNVGYLAFHSSTLYCEDKWLYIDLPTNQL